MRVSGGVWTLPVTALIALHCDIVIVQSNIRGRVDVLFTVVKQG